MPKIQQIKTDDGSATFHNPIYDETYHSKSGAIEESLKKFIQPANINQKKSIKILDFCFGIGYNSACALDHFTGTEIEIIALENDEDILNQIPDIDPKFESYDLIKELIEKNKNNKIKKLVKKIIDKNNLVKKTSITLIVDDARNSIKNQPDDSFDVVFFDPFSPKKCPELWTEEVFKQMNRIMKPGSILTTYSCASQVRKNMISSNLIPKDGPVIGRRAPSTIATKP